ncbi:hypothetical protein LTR37_015207 [Vermiconidia calcicola]|uniref:Uncharacterized protein n=1 Tax=Vermiconidia calcicola TaxID=1690605 RepID=A0ACC3MRF2_9PEZI|nr:hypothetical protein LTR37_015207 [Vermiconidia calcicola]
MAVPNNNQASQTTKPENPSTEPESFFLQTRKKGPSVPGRIAFTALRLLDLPWQYYLLKSGLGINILQRIGLTPLPQHSSIQTFLISGLNPYHTLILILAIGSSSKQIYWNHQINEQRFPFKFAVVVAVYNTVLNTLNALLSLWTPTSQQPGFYHLPPAAIFLGLSLYLLGLTLEWVSEIQRSNFKADPKNAGKPFSGGLFGYARNINYGGYALWRMGYSLCCGGLVWASVVGMWLVGDFVARAIPDMDAYCAQRYGKQWDEVRRKVPYKLLPWIY